VAAGGAPLVVGDVLSVYDIGWVQPFATALRRAQRLIDDPDGAVWYAARRIFAFALMIRDGIPLSEAEPYLHARP